MASISLFFGVFLFGFGAILGSFLSVLLHRIPRGQAGVVLGHSQCPVCQHRLSALDLIPILSYLALGGKCRYCSTKIPVLYPTLEALLGAVFVFVGLYIWPLPFIGMSSTYIWGLVFLLGVSFCLFAIATYDALYQEIPDGLVAPIIWSVIGILIAASTGFLPVSMFHFQQMYSGAWLSVSTFPITSGLVGAEIFLIFFGIQMLLPALARAIMLRKPSEFLATLALLALFPLFLLFGSFALVQRLENYLHTYTNSEAWIGWGDISLGILIGLVVGANVSLYSIVFAYILGSILAFPLLVYKYAFPTKFSQNPILVVPFAPFLVGGLLVALAFGSDVALWLTGAING